jgi:Ni,Fe-hydrogenase I cytochrome b subunit
MISIKALHFLIYAILFIITTINGNKIFKIVQVLIISFESLLCLIKEPDMPFFGLSLMVVAILLAYGHGLYTVNMKYKLVATGTAIFSAFYFIHVDSILSRIMHSIEDLGFIAIELFVLWAIFKDIISKFEYNGKHILEVAEEATSIARDAIELSKECGEGNTNG